MKAVAYMMDTNAWSGYEGEHAEYAIGGPTIEMIMKSYSEKYGVDYRAQASSTIGYLASKDGGASWSDYIASMLSTSDSTYVITSENIASGMWVASPSAYSHYNSTNSIVYLNCDGSINSSTIDFGQWRVPSASLSEI